MSDEREYPKLENQPLTLVLSEFRFSPVRLENDASDGFRRSVSDWLEVGCVERLRQSVRVDLQGVHVSPGLFLSWSAPERGCWLHLESHRVIFATTRYPRFNGLSEQCAEVLTRLMRFFELQRMERVGLRYNDCVIPEADEHLGLYLDKALLPSERLSIDQPVLHHGSESVFETGSGQIAVRSLVGMHGMAVMPDVSQQFESLALPHVPADRVVAVLDFDHFWQALPGESAGFSLDHALVTLGELHQPARRAFWRVTTEYARKEKWR